ncbi:MAG: aminotransferase class I/II-fold pyridoxal phosphate-dependent enzyme [Acidobacteriaceae bacterium]
MIDLQFNFPMLVGQDAVWAEHVRASLEAQAREGMAALRPSFRGGGEDRLKEMAAAWLGEVPQRVALTCSGHHGCLVALMAAELAGKRVVVEEVTYTGFVEQARMLGVELVACAMDGEGLRADALREICERARVAGRPIAAVFMMPTLHNPVGCVQSMERRRAVVEVVREFEVVVIEDDAYGYLLPESAAVESYAKLAPERTFYVRGLSKSFAPVVRTGLMVVPVEYAAAVANAVKQSSSGVSRVFAGASCTMLADGTLDRVMAAKRVEGARRQAAARELMEGLEVKAGPNAWHLWVSLPEGLSPEDAERRCEERGVLVSGGNWFAAPGARVPRAVRLGLGGEVEFERAMEGVRVFVEVVRAR